MVEAFDSRKKRKNKSDEIFFLRESFDLLIHCDQISEISRVKMGTNNNVMNPSYLILVPTVDSLAAATFL